MDIQSNSPGSAVSLARSSGSICGLIIKLESIYQLPFRVTLSNTNVARRPDNKLQNSIILGYTTGLCAWTVEVWKNKIDLSNQKNLLVMKNQPQCFVLVQRLFGTDRF